jgi:hypothetical protein
MGGIGSNGPGGHDVLQVLASTAGSKPVMIHGWMSLQTVVCQYLATLRKVQKAGSDCQTYVDSPLPEGQISCQNPPAGAKNPSPSYVLSLTRPSYHVEWIEGSSAYPAPVPGHISGPSAQWVWDKRLGPNAGQAQRLDVPPEGIEHVSSVTEKERKHHY